MRQQPSAALTSDASGSWGCGAYSDSGAWFQFQWPKAWARIHITTMEQFPIVVGCAVWGHAWKGKTIRCLCDNAAVVAILRSGSAKYLVTMHMVRCLFFFTAVNQLVLAPMHLPGRDNAVADHLSRNAFQSFLQLVPKAEQQPTVLPEPLMQALVVHRSDCTSQAWRDVLRSFSPMVWPVHPREHTSPAKTCNVLLLVRIVTSTIDRVAALLICVLPSGSVFSASHYKDIYVRSKILADKVGLWRPIHGRYATSRLRDERNKEGASNFGERC